MSVEATIRTEAQTALDVLLECAQRGIESHSPIVVEKDDEAYAVVTMSASDHNDDVMRIWSRDGEVVSWRLMDS